MRITELVVKELKLTNVTELEPFATVNGVTVVELEAAEGHFRVHLVRDSQYLNVKLEEGSKLAAYYNSLFWHEISTANKIGVPSARFKTSFRVSDGDVKHSVFITQIEKTGRALPRLALPQLEQVARQIALLHAVTARLNTAEFETAVQENYENIKVFRKKIRKEIVEVLELALTNEISQFFAEPTRILQKVGILTHHLEHAPVEEEREAEHVITHGRLTADTCRFDEQGKLVELTEWENIHLGNPVEDLANIIITSASGEIRRKFMKVFSVYFYTLIDLRPPNYQLPDLKRWFLEHQAELVVNGIEGLLLTLSESSDFELKRESARRWESVLNDAVDFITGNYVSDDEHVFLAQKKDDEEEEEK
ncbi:unnamed protein product [Caenorhabditis sp. 36 PRJEB53466]|nr:unnamed protein product [Caenorhabditis sp. 36 PRJEB53466]